MDLSKECMDIILSMLQLIEGWASELEQNATHLYDHGLTVANDMRAFVASARDRDANDVG